MTQTERKQQMLKITEAIWQEFKFTYPLNLPLVVHQLGGRIKIDPELTVEAKVKRRRKGGFSIILQKDMGQPYGSFQIAHLLGHLFLHMGYLTPKWNKAASYHDSVHHRSFAYTEEENQATQFAIALLLPCGLLQDSPWLAGRIFEKSESENLRNPP